MRNIYWILVNQFGIDLLKLAKSFYRFPKFLYEYFRIVLRYKGKVYFKPCIHDKYETNGSVNHEYFWQDLFVSQKIYANNPIKHVDVGSRIDGFVANVAAYRNVEVFDIRPIGISIQNVKFTQLDIMNQEELHSLLNNQDGYSDSLSCLHTLEHFGLGRYGDTFNLNGYKQGLSNLSKILKADGIFYLSTPIGHEKIEFNANWIFNPKKILNICEQENLKLLHMYAIESKKMPYEIFENDLELIINNNSSLLVLFIFKKIINEK